MPNTTQRPRPKSTQRARARRSLSPILARTAPRSPRRTAPSSVRPADPCPRPSPRGPSTRFFFLNFKLSSPSNFCPVFLRQFQFNLIKQKQTLPYNFSLTRRKKKSRSAADAKGGEKVSVVVLEGGEVVGRGVGCRGRGEDHGRQGGQAHQAHQALQAHQGPFDTGTRGTRDAPGEGREPLCARREDAGSTGGKGGKEGKRKAGGRRGRAARRIGRRAAPRCRGRRARGIAAGH